ncbi:MAG: hypothetical protein WC523_04290 [Patescibacteria group bacterium]
MIKKICLFAVFMAVAMSFSAKANDEEYKTWTTSSVTVTRIVDKQTSVCCYVTAKGSIFCIAACGL